MDLSIVSLPHPEKPSRKKAIATDSENPNTHITYIALPEKKQKKTNSQTQTQHKEAPKPPDQPLFCKYCSKQAASEPPTAKRCHTTGRRTLAVTDIAERNGQSSQSVRQLGLHPLQLLDGPGAGGQPSPPLARLLIPRRVVGGGGTERRQRREPSGGVGDGRQRSGHVQMDMQGGVIRSKYFLRRQERRRRERWMEGIEVEWPNGKGTSYSARPFMVYALPLTHASSTYT